MLKSSQTNKYLPTCHKQQQQQQQQQNCYKIWHFIPLHGMNDNWAHLLAADKKPQALV
jgi:hypothetical protein